MGRAVRCVDPLENEGVVGWAAAALPDLRLERPRSAAGARPGLLHCGLPPELCPLVLRFDPAEDDTVIGFFAAVFTKRPSDAADGPPAALGPGGSRPP
jgi:16S rRNA C967 or C1407 C5-methylase (RsmB/RsmF family)